MGVRPFGMRGDNKTELYMTAEEIITALIGFVILGVMFTMVVILILGVIWWVFKTDMDIEIETEKWEEEQ